MHPRVVAVSTSAQHRFSKENSLSIRLIEGLGVEGDAHAGATVKHRSRVARDPSQPNLRQVHLIHSELHDLVRSNGFDVRPGDMGENITTRGVDLLSLPTGSILRIGNEAEVEVTGLRNPCVQIDRFMPGLLAEVLGKDGQGNLIRKAGVMGVVRKGGEIYPGDPITVEVPDGPLEPLRPV